MQGNTLARATMIPISIAVLIGVGWSMWPSQRVVSAEIAGLPDWGFVEVRFGRRLPVPPDDGIFRDAVRYGPQTLHVRGGVGSPEDCVRCCWALEKDLIVAKGGQDYTIQATVPECPTAAAGYTDERVEVGTAVIEGETIQVRHPVFVGPPVPVALWDGAAGCGQDAVRCVAWIDVIRFTNRLSKTEGLTPAYYYDEAHVFPYSDQRDGRVFWDRAADGWRLPTEAEWVHAVGTTADWEWTWDRYALPYDGVVREQAASGPRAVRGPGRTSRNIPGEDLGFRLVRNAPIPQPPPDGELLRPTRER